MLIHICENKKYSAMTWYKDNKYLSGILSEKTIDDKLMYSTAPNYDKQNYSSEDYSYWWKGLDTFSLYNQSLDKSF